jgi:hypothetical protein
MNKIILENKDQIDHLVNIIYLKDSKSGRIKKDMISKVSKQNANYLVKHGIAKLI